VPRAFPLIASLYALTLAAQQPAPYTLHVYANLIQVQTLVLTPQLTPVPSIPAQDFRISLDDGPRFRPSKVHLEQNDPLQLAIFLDDSGSVQPLIDHFPADFALLAAADLHPGDLPPEDLHADDAYTLYAADCILIASPAAIAVGPDRLRTAAATALNFPTLHGNRKRPACGAKLKLWDDVGYALRRLANLPGRRVLLLISSGKDRASTATSLDVIRFAQLHSIVIFALNDLYNIAPLTTAVPLGPRGTLSQVSVSPSPDDAYNELCAYTGGLLLATGPGDQATDLHRILSLLRSRYVVEFPRSNDSRPGNHNIGITIENRPTLIIRAAGVAVEPVDTRLLNDPSTIPTAPSQATYGNHPPPRH
jgi:hypothetical protein